MQPLVALILARAAAFDGYPHVCDGVPCGPGHETCGAPHAPAAVIHLQDPTCDMNDPNAPFVDDRGAHHVFFQKRICRSTGGAEQGPVWGHAVSKDLARWSFLPVAIWNGPEAWSAKAIYTGSATRTDDGVVVVYAGRGFPNAFGAALPDPTFETYAKRDGPLIEKTDDDPSTAWRYEGTWRMIAKGGKMPGCTIGVEIGVHLRLALGLLAEEVRRRAGDRRLPLQVRGRPLPGAKGVVRPGFHR